MRIVTLKCDTAWTSCNEVDTCFDAEAVTSLQDGSSPGFPCTQITLAQPLMQTGLTLRTRMPLAEVRKAIGWSEWSEADQKVAKSALDLYKAYSIIDVALEEAGVRGGYSKWSQAIVARLAQHGMLLCTADELKE